MWSHNLWPHDRSIPVVPDEAMFAASVYRDRKSPATAILLNQEARGAKSAKRVPQDLPTSEIGQRTKLPGLDGPEQDRQPLSLRVQNKGLQIPVRDLARWSDIIIGYVARRSGTQFADQIGWQAESTWIQRSWIHHQRLSPTRGCHFPSKRDPDVGRRPLSVKWPCRGQIPWCNICIIQCIVNSIMRV